MQLGIWPAEYAQGEKYRAILFAADGYKDDEIRELLRDYVKYNYRSDMQSYQLRGERASRFFGGSAASSGANHALFGTPIDRSKENTDRMHAITLSMGADTGKQNREAHAYNPAIVPIYALKNKNGTFVLPSGGSTADRDKARVYTDRAEAERHCLSTQEIVEV